MANINGTLGPDVLSGTPLADHIMGLDGNDLIAGGSGNDSINAGAGNDSIHGDNGADEIFGWSGNDVIYGDAGDDVLNGGSGNDVLVGGAGGDVMNGGAGDDTFVGLIGSDLITGGSGFDTLDYSSAVFGIDVDLSTHAVMSGPHAASVDGIERVIGSNLADTFYGDSGVNVFQGGGGDDVFRSKGGADTLMGGAGHDTFIYLKKDAIVAGKAQGTDLIKDLSAGDKIDLADFFKTMPGANVAQSIKLSFDGANTTLAVKVHGAFVDVVALQGNHGTDTAHFASDYILAA